MPISTRQQLLDIAKRLFAEKGFYGVSIAAIAKEMSVSKQALLHHFGTKEKLYAEVLRGISQELQSISDAVLAQSTDPKQTLIDLILVVYERHLANAYDVKLIMRELLDNEQRAERAGQWYLKDYLNALIDALLQVPGYEHYNRARALSVVYGFIGAAHYFAISGPTLSHIFDADFHQQMQQEFAAECRRNIEARLSIQD